MIRTVFFGTPPAAVPTLRRLAAETDVVAVVTRPDRRRSRSAPPEPSAVKAEAAARGLAVLEPATRSELVAAVAGLAGLDVGVVVAYGMLLPVEVLTGPAGGILNVHFSLLPRWRGAAPVERAILAGDRGGGVSIIALDEGLDTGPVLAVHATAFGAEETAGDITSRLAAIGADLLSAVLPGNLTGVVTAVAQDTSAATYADRLSATDGALDPAEGADPFCRRVRAMTPRPGAFGFVGGERLKVLAARPAEGTDSPGALGVDDGRLVCGVAGGRVELVEVQAPGRRAMAGIEWARGRKGGLGTLTPVAAPGTSAGAH